MVPRRGVGAEPLALRGFPHLRGVLAGLVDGLNEIRSPEESLRRNERHERSFAADTVDRMEGKRAVGENIAAVHTGKFERYIFPALLQKIGCERPHAIDS